MDGLVTKGKGLSKHHIIVRYCYVIAPEEANEHSTDTTSTDPNTWSVQVRTSNCWLHIAAFFKINQSLIWLYYLTINYFEVEIFMGQITIISNYLMRQQT